MTAFFFFGLLCLFSVEMQLEFQRYGLAKYRKIVGSFEVLGAIGLLGGYFYQPFILPSSLGLAILMLLGTYTRIRIKDSFIQTLPAAILCVLNVILFVQSLTVLG